MSFKFKRVFPSIGVICSLSMMGISPTPGQTFQQGHFLAQDGAAIFKSVCQGCHMADAKGAVGAGAYPSLAGNAKLKIPAYPLYVVVNGQRAMPAFGPSFDDAQVAEVLNYVRTHFGNHYPKKITAEEVKAARPAPH